MARREREPDATLPGADGRCVPARAVPPAVSRDPVRRRHRPRARAGRQASRSPDQHPHLHRLGAIHQALVHHGGRERRPDAHRRADRDGRWVHRRGHDLARARRGGRPHERGHDLGGRGHRGRAGRDVLLGSGRYDAARPGRPAGTRERRAPGSAAIHAEHLVGACPPQPHRPGRVGSDCPPDGARDRTAGEPSRERGPRDRLHAARAQAAARRGHAGAAPSTRRPDRVHGRVKPPRRIVVDLASPLAAWRMPPVVADAIRAALGPNWEVVLVQAPAASDGDGGSGSPEAVAAARGAEIYVGYGVPPGVVAAGKGTLKWAHSGTAGVGTSLPHLAGSGVVLTNSAAVHAEPIADWAIAAIAYFARGLDRMREFQAAGQWARPAFADLEVRVRELGELRLGVFGLGGIGSAIARRGVALGMSVAGVRRRPARGGPRGVRWVGGLRDLPRLAAESDCLVIAAPHTAETRDAVSGAVLARLPPDAIVVNVSRGTLLDETALLEALDAARLRGAALDVFATEPLPPGHPLWRHPRVLVSPHVARAGGPAAGAPW